MSTKKGDAFERKVLAAVKAALDDLEEFKAMKDHLEQLRQLGVEAIED